MRKRIPFMVAAVAFVVSPGSAGADKPPSVLEQDQTRIRKHLSAVEAYLREQDTSHLDDIQQAARAENIVRLHDYWVAGVFPHNTIAGHPTPIFVDTDGRACAVAHLMIESGYQGAVGDIVGRQNLAYVNDINSPALVQWLQESGLTGQEAAWIQPGYNRPPCNEECSCDPDPVCTSSGLTMVNPCFAENCFAEFEYVSGCCAVADEIVWAGPDTLADVEICEDNPNARAEAVCPEAVTPPPMGDSQGCASATLPDHSRWAHLLVFAGLMLLLRRRGVSP